MQELYLYSLYYRQRVVSSGKEAHEDFDEDSDLPIKTFVPCFLHFSIS